MNIAEVFANPVALAEEIQKFKDHNWTGAEWDLFCESLKPFKELLRAVHDEAYEKGETAGFNDGEAKGYERAEKHTYDGKEEAHEEGYKKGYEAAKKKNSVIPSTHPTA